MYNPIGYKALVLTYNLSVLPHYVESYIANQGRGQIRVEKTQETHIYPKNYALKEPNNPFSQIEFAIKYEGVNLEILVEVFKKIDSNEVEKHIQQHPTSKYSRIIWFLYEYLMKVKLNISDAKKLQYIDVLDPERYFTGRGIKSPRHYINNNLLGTDKFCPVIRKTKTLKEYIAKEYDVKAKALTEKYDPQVIARASHYLFTKETMSSYEIEREKPSKERMVRFINLLRKAYKLEKLTKEQLIELQNVIVDPRFKDLDYRREQNYVGENVNQYIQKIHYISPQPKDIESLMQGLLETLERSLGNKIHPVIIAAMISFGFVFIHPFEDGNGRIHRFLIHYILSKENFTPEGIIFPISAVMLQNMKEYDQILETFSKPLLELIKDYKLTNEGVLLVKQETHSYYKYIDYSLMAEYLFECIDKTLQDYFEKELDFLTRYDKTKLEIQAIIDMPDKFIDLFIKFTMQNQGLLGEQKKDKYFYKLTDKEIKKLESIVKENMLNNSSV